MASSDQFARYRDALAGKPIEWERGDPASGFYKRTGGDGRTEAICIFRDDAGEMQCIRNIFGDGSNLDADKIEELFASVSVYPIAEEVFRDVTEHGKPWPPGYETRLTMKDQAAGVVWSPEYGRKKLGLAENERATIGGNNPPEATEPEGHKVAGEQTPDKALFAEVSALAGRIKTWLTGIGGKPRNKDEADQLGDYATKFGELAKKSEAERTAEKAPHLEAGRAIDAKWKVPKDLSDVSRRRALHLAQEWMDAENARRAEVAETTETEAKPVTSVGNVRSVSTRSRTVYVLTDARAYLTHLMAQEGELPSDLTEAAGKIAARRAMEAPGVEKQTERKAA